MGLFVLVVEQDMPLFTPVGLMWTLRARLDLDRDGGKVVFRRLGGELGLRTLESGHTVIAISGWHPPPEIFS